MPNDALRTATRCANVLGHVMGGLSPGAGATEVVICCFRCGGFVAARCGLLTEVCRFRPASVGTQTRLRRILRGLHPTRNETVTRPWPVGRSPPSAGAAPRAESAPLLGNQAARHRADGLGAMAEANVGAEPERMMPAGLGDHGSMSTRLGEGSALAICRNLPMYTVASGLSRRGECILPRAATAAVAAAAPLLGNQAARPRAEGLDAMAEVTVLDAPEPMMPAGLGDEVFFEEAQNAGHSAPLLGRGRNGAASQGHGAPLPGVAPRQRLGGAPRQLDLGEA